MKSYRKPHRYKKRKPIFRKKFLVLGFLALVAVGAVFYGLFFWKIFWVEKIVVSGEEKVSKEKIESLVEQRLENRILFLKTKSILAVDGGQIEKDILDAFPGISETKVNKRLFDTINVQVIERTGLALWCKDDDCFLLDKYGVIFEEAPLDSELIIIETTQLGELFLGKNVIAEDKIVQILAIENKLAETSKISIKKAILVSNDRLDMETAEGWAIRFNLKSDLDWQLTELKLALEKQISAEKRKNLEYIDLRFSRVYYK